MSISDTCKFEVKTNVDRVQREKNISRRKAIALVADEIGLIEETVRTMDRRARSWVQPEPKKSNTATKPTTYEPSPQSTTHPVTNRGGRRDGTGRKPLAPHEDNSNWEYTHHTYQEFYRNLKETIMELSTMPEWKANKTRILGEVDSLLYFVNDLK